MASCFQHINECLYVVKSQLRSHWAKLKRALADAQESHDAMRSAQSDAIREQASARAAENRALLAEGKLQALLAEPDDVEPDEAPRAVRAATPGAPKMR